MSKQLDKILNRVRDVVSFQPTDAQKRARSNFWAEAELLGIDPQAEVQLSVALKYGGDRRISTWWEDDQFRDWFLNGKEFKQRADFLAHVALDELEGIIRDRAGNTAARVAAIKTALEISGKSGKNAAQSQNMLDEKVSQMTQEELEKFIQSKLNVLPTN